MQSHLLIQSHFENHFRAVIHSCFILAPNLSTMDDPKKLSSPLYTIHDYSTWNRTYAAITTFFAFLGEWMILFITFSLALFFVPLTPSFTLHSTTTSMLNVTSHNTFKANLGVSFFVENTNPLGGTINYDSFNFSLFQRQKSLSTFSLQQDTATLHAKFPNVSVTVDEWGHHHQGTSSCGFAYLDLWFSVDAARDTLQGHCGEVRFELCGSSDANNVEPSFLASCDVYSALVHKVRLGVLLLLILLLVGAAPVPILVEQFF